MKACNSSQQLANPIAAWSAHLLAIAAVEGQLISARLLVTWSICPRRMATATVSPQRPASPKINPVGGETAGRASFDYANPNKQLQVPHLPKAFSLSAVGKAPVTYLTQGYLLGSTSLHFSAELLSCLS